MKALTELEALRLSIYFEEVGAYNHKRNREMEAQSASGSANESVETIPDDEENE